MSNGSGTVGAVVAIVMGVILVLAGAALMVSSIGGDASLLFLIGGIAVAAAGAMLIGGNLRRGLAGDRSEVCPGCMDPIVPGAEKCPNCGHVY